MDKIEIHTNFTNAVVEVRVIPLEDLGMPENLKILKWVFTEPESLRPGTTRDEVTKDAADEFASLAQRLRDRGHEPGRVSHFVNKLLFCMFAEDIGILPKKVFLRILEAGTKDPAKFISMAGTLFAAMRSGGDFGADAIDWFNGGLFDDDDVVPLDRQDLEQTLRTAMKDWSNIEPSIFGTLFERFLDPNKRSQLGAHYTDRQSIMRIVEPVVVRPLQEEWELSRSAIADLVARAAAADDQAAKLYDLAKSSATKAIGAKRQREGAALKGTATKLLKEASDRYETFRERLATFKVLDP
ncbi:MAG: class I SAM-dependent DNA methyltransferase, partial [Cyanobacteria bacterium REEB65]|nr:class I SAM-dependent DNA methyltransferase [Cyanobacteria bacterium REEB65]